MALDEVAHGVGFDVGFDIADARDPPRPSQWRPRPGNVSSTPMAEVSPTRSGSGDEGFSPKRHAVHHGVPTTPSSLAAQTPSARDGDLDSRPHSGPLVIVARAGPMSGQSHVRDTGA